MSLPFLLEIGTEEIPDWMIPPALNYLQDSFQRLLDANSLGGAVRRMDATPRRLTLFADGVIAKQPDSEEIVLGPPASAGPGAAAGFAKKMGTRPDQLTVRQTAKGDYYSFQKSVAGKQSAAILAAELPALILKTYFPKTMYWNGKGTSRFIRPVRWIVALLDGGVVPFEIEGVGSGAHTQGHRILGRKDVPVSITNYEQLLESQYVILSADQRRARIESGIAKLVEGRGLRVKRDERLLETLVYITEYPTPILGGFDAEYLSLPQEVLITVMRHHQKYFSVSFDNGELAPHFIAVMNTVDDPDGLVRHGNERVLRARFNDARFFWEADLKCRLADRVEDLKNVTFLKELGARGSYFEKTQRTAELVKKLGGNAHAERAALLGKCDLTTGMVKEFTDLQGVMGGLYAREQGEPEEVWRAVYEHYKPLSMEDSIPATETGRLLAFADKWDTLRECFAVGPIPSGSKDPFALRRAAQGIVRILVEGRLPVQLEADTPELADFLRDRVEYYFREVRGFHYDEVRAVLAAGWHNPPDVEARLEALREVRPTENFEPLAASFKRIRNILRQANYAGAGAIDEALLEPGPERDLYVEFRRVRAATEGQPYRDALAAVASMRPQVDLFFDKVLVNAKEPAVRQNRLALLANLLTEFSTIADFSEIVTEKQT